jgi:hypothetical protein
MKKLILIFSIILFSSFKGYSQKQVDTTVCMPIGVAKQVAADLVTGDSAKAMLEVTIEELDLSNQKLSYKDSLIVTAKIKEMNLTEQVKNERFQKEATMALYSDLKKDYANLSKEYKTYRWKKKLSGALMVTGLVLLTAATILK